MFLNLQIKRNSISKHVDIHSTIFKMKLKLLFIANVFQIDVDRYERCAIRKMNIFTEHEMLFLWIDLWLYFISVSNWIRTYFVILGFQQEFQGFLFFVIFWQLHSTNDKKFTKGSKEMTFYFQENCFSSNGNLETIRHVKNTPQYL